jgi:hypothetical protein
METTKDTENKIKIGFSILPEQNLLNLGRNLAVCALIFSLFGASVPAYASTPLPTALIPQPFLLSYQDFVASLPKTQASTLVGIYSPGVLALPIEQQPLNKPGYVVDKDGVASQFRLASQYGSTGILAHNTRSGITFFDLKVGTPIFLIYGDGSVKTFLVASLESYQALSPRSAYSDFINLDKAEPRLTATDLFYRIYAQKDRLVLQTCIEANGDASWGRLFVIAVPYEVTKADNPYLVKSNILQ